MEQQTKHTQKTKFDFLLGRKIWIVSCPRYFDNADAFANTEATIDQVYSDGGLALILKNGGCLVIPQKYINRLKYIVL